jgi:predicted Zn-ribbon and HTH transcriptional regulator
MSLFIILQEEMLKEVNSVTNHDSQTLIAKVRDRPLVSSPIFILCDRCYWCATYFDKTKIPMDNTCPQCNANNNELTSFPIMPNESFTFDYNDKHGVELE